MTTILLNMEYKIAQYMFSCIITMYPNNGLLSQQFHLLVGDIPRIVAAGQI